MNHSNDKAAGCCPKCREEKYGRATDDYYCSNPECICHHPSDKHCEKCYRYQAGSRWCVDRKCICHTKPPTDLEDNAIEAIVKVFIYKYNIDKSSKKFGYLSSEVKTEYAVNWLRTALRSYGDKRAREEYKGNADDVAHALEVGKEEGRKEALDELAEKVKSVNGDPFEDSEEMLEGYAYSKAKILALIAEMKK